MSSANTELWVLLFSIFTGHFAVKAGDGLLSHDLAVAVPSALTGLTAVFGMGTGVALSRWSPAKPTTSAWMEWERVCDETGRDQAARAISKAWLKRLRALHLPPINVVVCHGPLGVLRPRSDDLGAGFPLICFQRLSLPDIANRRCHWRDSRDTSGPSNPVLSY